jgi:hypothetical protein
VGTGFPKKIMLKQGARVPSPAAALKSALEGAFFELYLLDAI